MCSVITNFHLCFFITTIFNACAFAVSGAVLASSKACMCGIYVAQATNAGEKVLAGLKRLEYRGYDSWGVTVLAPDQDYARQGSFLQLEKHVGKIGEVTGLTLSSGQVALGHTRWATHGGVTQTNAHPHLSSDGSFALVQNGVVENYQELKSVLEEQGYTFKTQTDTEVIVALLEQELKTGAAYSLEVITRVFKRLHGRSTVALLNTSGHIWAFRYGSPLIVGKNNQEVFLASDVASLSADARDYRVIQNGEAVAITPEGEVAIYNLKTGEELTPAWEVMSVEALNFDKEGYAHFMLKEINEQAHVLHQVVPEQDQKWDPLKEVLTQARQVYTIGAGSASFAAGQIAFYLREVGINAVELKSYEAHSFKKIWSQQDVVIAISQSGETADTNDVIEQMKANGLTIVSLVNMNGSTLSSLSDIPLMLQVGPEIGVASTKALTAQMVWGKALSLNLSGQSLATITKKLIAFEGTIKIWLEDREVSQKIKEITSMLSQQTHLFVLGRGQLFYPSLESALKLKEISYLHAEGFSGGELKHGVIALIEKGTPVLCLVAEDQDKASMVSAAAEVKARGARVIGVSQENNDFFDDWIPVPADQDFAAISSILPSQLLTYGLAISKGLDPDKPRNLAKSVTVK